MNLNGTYRLDENCKDVTFRFVGYLSFLIRINQRCLHPRHPRTI